MGSFGTATFGAAMVWSSGATVTDCSGVDDGAGAAAPKSTVDAALNGRVPTRPLTTSFCWPLSPAAWTVKLTCESSALAAVANALLTDALLPAAATLPPPACAKPVSTELSLSSVLKPMISAGRHASSVLRWRQPCWPCCGCRRRH